ncbi:MAG: purine-nucleoside phosphorylase [Deltaproteobacteria bacterium RIFCSPHIGHO2_02_FULL_40_11]|nr:MAG: purine-nucleoside phosphorylase [Deltaproteobacteria bacterium RIFCSPHIGHO2_02_FULL_40_11]
MNKIHIASAFIKGKQETSAKIAIILGSGLGEFAETLEDRTTISYQDIPGFPQVTVPGHKGQLVFGTINQIPVVIMQGRMHYYEGYALEDTTFPIRVFHQLGIRTLIVTNSAGGISRKFRAGHFMAIQDHLNFMGVNPLRGKNLDQLGPRFVDMSHTYDQDLRKHAKKCAKKVGLKLHEGVYAALPGPTYETPAEVRMLKTLGADAVGMSTVPEVIVAKHQNMKVFGLSCISNLAASAKTHSVNHQEVLDTTQKVSKIFGQFMKSFIITISHG